MFRVLRQPLWCFILLSGLFSVQTSAATVTEYWNITWVTANPDGQFPRRAIGINGTFPLPKVEVNKGDRLVLHMYNGLGDQNTGLHFHGLFQNGTTHMDGPAYVNQCPVAPGGSMTYNFTVDQPGTYWYHSHVKGQYPDGLRGQFLVHDPEDPHKDLYDFEITLSLSDWYHQEMTVLRKQFISIANPTGAEPVPDSALMNDSQNITYNVEPGKTYLVRIVNMAAFAPQYVWFEDHTVRVVEVDGVYTEPYEAQMIYVTPAQRYSVLLTTKNETGRNYPFVGSMDEDLFDTVPDTLNPNVTGWFVYDSSATNPAPKEISEFNPMDDALLVPVDGMDLLGEPDYSFTMNVTMQNLGDGANYAFFNDITYVAPKVPTLYTALSAGELANNPAVYGYNSQAKVLNHNDIIEIQINNQDSGKHPFHLHGHNFQVVYRSDEEAGDFDPSAVDTNSYPSVPMRRDVILTRPDGNVVIRFRADNPGIWLFHCHLEWHLDSGLVATMVEAPLLLQSQLENKIPADHLDACKSLDIPIVGNAAANTVDLLDLTGANKPPGRIPKGFTPRGIVALTFSIISAILGLMVIGWYGAAEIPGAKSAGRGGILTGRVV